ncbi:MAG: oligosaccharide flippase family protein [Bacteroidia bacterium]|nr:oligosaccharide flippase family protein [Bacteroidia bacterium]
MKTGRYFKTEFSKNVLTLLSGTAIAQAIPILISPVISRMYSPAEYGVYTAFFNILMIFGILANARYELAIVLPEKDEDAINLVAVGVFLSISLSLVLLVVIIFFNE